MVVEILPGLVVSCPAAVMNAQAVATVVTPSTPVLVVEVPTAPAVNAFLELAGTVMAGSVEAVSPVTVMAAVLAQAVPNVGEPLWFAKLLLIMRRLTITFHDNQQRIYKNVNSYKSTAKDQGTISYDDGSQESVQGVMNFEFCK